LGSEWRGFRKGFWGFCEWCDEEEINNISYFIFQAALYQQHYIRMHQAININNIANYELLSISTDSNLPFHHRVEIFVKIAKYILGFKLSFQIAVFFYSFVLIPTLLLTPNLSIAFHLLASVFKTIFFNSHKEQEILPT
jgi:hypothetical protein